MISTRIENESAIKMFATLKKNGLTDKASMMAVLKELPYAKWMFENAKPLLDRRTIIPPKRNI